MGVPRLTKTPPVTTVSLFVPRTKMDFPSSANVDGLTIGLTSSVPTVLFETEKALCPTTETPDMEMKKEPLPEPLAVRDTTFPEIMTWEESITVSPAMLMPNAGARDAKPTVDTPTTDRTLLRRPRMDPPCTVTPRLLEMILHVCVPVIRPQLPLTIRELPWYRNSPPAATVIKCADPNAVTVKDGWLSISKLDRTRVRVLAM